MATSTAGHSLSGRMLWLTIGIVLTTEALVLAPELARERQRWLAERFALADTAILVNSASQGAEIDPETRDALLRRAGAVEIHLIDSGKHLVAMGTDSPGIRQSSIDLREESWGAGLWRSLTAFASDGSRILLVADRSPFTVGTEIELALPERGLKQALWQFAGQYALLSLLIAGVNGALVYFALVMFLVTPMRRITNSIMAFRSDPERVTPLDPRRVTILPDDEMALAGREIAAMQRVLSNVLGRNARLVSVGTSVAKIGHDLRNVLSPALLTAERLSLDSNPSVRRAGEVIMTAVDRANDLVGQTLKFVRDSPAPLAAINFPLAPLVAEAIDAVGGSSTCRMRMEIGDDLVAYADPEQILRALLNLIRNGAEAGSRTVIVRTAGEVTTAAPSTGQDARLSPPLVAIDVVDDGHGLPEAVRETLFRPFTRSTKSGGSGLGLAIAHDLMRANNGDITLVATGAGGTVFRMVLPTVPARVEA
jgi:signal transduction histidine kinase